MGNDTDGFSDTSTLVWHGGNAFGSASAVLYHPESDITVAVIFTRDYVSGASIARNVLDRLIDVIAAGLPVTESDLGASVAPLVLGLPDDGVRGTFAHP